LWHFNWSDIKLHIESQGSAEPLAVKSESRKLGEIQKYLRERNRAPIVFEKLLRHSLLSMKII
jgi:hypothetical protein